MTTTFPVYDETPMSGQTMLEQKAEQERKINNPDIHYYSIIENKLAGLNLTNMHIDDRLFITHLRRCILEKKIEIPLLPLVVLKINKLVSQPNVNMSQLTEAVRSDQKLTLKTIAMANSAIFGGGQTSSLELAISKLGLNTLRGVVMASVMQAKLLKNKQLNDLALYVWFHCYSTGLLAIKFARYFRVYSDSAFLAGFFHDLGKLIVLNMINQVERLRPEREMKFSLTKIKNIYQLIHPALGAMIVAMWKIDLKIIEAIEYHHDSEQNSFPLLNLLMLCNMATHTLIDKKPAIEEVIAFVEKKRMPLPPKLLMITLKEFLPELNEEKQKLLQTL